LAVYTIHPWVTLAARAPTTIVPTFPSCAIRDTLLTLAVYTIHPWVTLAARAPTTIVPTFPSCAIRDTLLTLAVYTILPWVTLAARAPTTIGPAFPSFAIRNTLPAPIGSTIPFDPMSAVTLEVVGSKLHAAARDPVYIRAWIRVTGIVASALYYQHTQYCSNDEPDMKELRPFHFFSPCVDGWWILDD